MEKNPLTIDVDGKLRISFSLPKELPAGAAIEGDGIYRVLLNEGRAVLNTPVKKPDPGPGPDSTQSDKSGEPKTERSLLGLILILAGQGRCRRRRKKVLAISEKLR